MRKFMLAFLTAAVLFGYAATASAFGSAVGQALGALQDNSGNTTTSAATTDPTTSDVLAMLTVIFSNIGI